MLLVHSLGDRTHADGSNPSHRPTRGLCGYEQQELPFTAGGDAGRCRHLGRQFGGLLQNRMFSHLGSYLEELRPRSTLKLPTEVCSGVTPSPGAIEMPCLRVLRNIIWRQKRMSYRAIERPEGTADARYQVREPSWEGDSCMTFWKRQNSADVGGPAVARREVSRSRQDARAVEPL